MDLSPGAAYLLDVLNDSGYGAWLVGGCVRDSLRGVKPHDYDIATTALPSQVMACFPDFYVVPTGIRHGTVSVVADGGVLEVTTLRTDGVYSDGRRPDGVTFVNDIEADLARRDFTVNAMAWSCVDGLVDPFGGQQDLKSGLLRCVGDPVTRLREDSLRIMRCLRFAACLGFKIDSPTEAALYSERGALENVAAERLNSELSLLICGKRAGQVIGQYHNILSVIIPDIILDIDQNVFNSAGDDCVVRLALLLNMEKPEGVLKHLRYDAETVKAVSALSTLMRRPLPHSREDAADLTAWAGRARVKQLMHIWQAWSMTAQPDDTAALSAAEDYMRQVLGCGCCGVEELAIDGDNLIDMGMLPGREIGRVLGEITRAVMAGNCKNEPRALTALARRLYRGE